MSNPFFERNTISNWTELSSQREGLSKVRAKRAQSVANIKINTSKFQHREVFDSQIYQKINFFKLGMKELVKHEKGSSFDGLVANSKQLSSLLGDKNMANFGKNYCNLWNLLPESIEKDNIVKAMTEAITHFFKKIVERLEHIIKAKQEVEQQLMRVQVDLKFTRK